MARSSTSARTAPISLRGVETIAVDLDQKAADIGFRPALVTRSQIEDALAEAGYPVTPPATAEPADDVMAE